MLRTHDSSDLSDQAIATAVRGLILESKRCSERMNSEGLAEEEAEHLSECAYNLFRSLTEFEELYRARQTTNTKLVPFDELYATLSGFDWLMGREAPISDRKSGDNGRSHVAVLSAVQSSPRVVPLSNRRSGRDG
jgi:hypothetical protein